MPTRITQIDDTGAGASKFKGGVKDDQVSSSETESQAIVLKVEGTLHLKDAELLEKICRDLRSQTGRAVTLDLASLSFIDSDSASMLCLLKREQESGWRAFTFS